MKIAIVDRYFFPDLQSSAVYLTEIAHHLAQNHEVDVYCGTPSSFKTNHQDIRCNLTVHHLSVSSFPRTNLLGRFINYLTFIAACFIRVLFCRRPDVLMVQTTPPLNVFFVACVCLMRRIPMVYVCNDLFPQTARAVGKLGGGVLFWWLDSMNRFALRQACFVVVLGDDMKERMVDLGIPAERIKVIRFWADLNEIQLVAKRNSFSLDHDLANDFVVMHAGNMGLVHELELILEVARELKDYRDISFVFVGDGVQKTKLLALSKQYGLNKVKFIDFSSREKLSEVFASADLQMVVLKEGVWGYSVPSKIYSVMTSGRAVLAVVHEKSEVTKLIQVSQCGIVTNCFTAKEVAEEIVRLYRNRGKLDTYGTNGRRFMEQNRGKEKGLMEYEQVLTFAGERKQ